MNIELEFLQLQLNNPFKLSYGATTIRENVLVHITDGELSGVGEAAVVPYYGESPQRIADYFAQPNLLSLIEGWRDDFAGTLAQLPNTPSMAARNALDCALHDLWGKSLGQPLYKLWGFSANATPLNSFTVAMADDEATYIQKLHQAANYPLIKLKLGAATIQEDLALVQLAKRELPTAQFCIDANAAWSANDALQLIPQVADLEVLFIEQPVAKTDWEGWKQLQTALPADHPPLIADESVQGLASLHQLAGLVDGINIKLAKCGGLDQARQMITVGRFYGMRIMLGCMVESSVAVTAASHLAAWADYLDLDGNLLIANDPYQGVQAQQGQLKLPIAAGLGVRPKST